MTIFATACFLLFISIISSSRIPIAINNLSKVLKHDLIKKEIRARGNFSSLLGNKKMFNAYHYPKADYSSTVDQKSEILKSYEEMSIEFYLKDRESVFKLLSNDAPISNHLLRNPKFFDEALNRGYRSLCLHLIQSTDQKIELLKENGDNLLVKIIEQGMSELFGVLLDKKRTETLKAFNEEDHSSGLTPLSAAIKYGDRLAVYYLVSERRATKN